MTYLKYTIIFFLFIVFNCSKNTPQGIDSQEDTVKNEIGTSLAKNSNLRIVEVGFPQINCIFDTDCHIYVGDFVDHFTLKGTSGDAFLQSRMWPQGEPGTVGEGLYAHIYRIDLRDLVSVTDTPCIQSFKIKFGPFVQIDYDYDGQLDDVFVGTSGGLGSVAPSSAKQEGENITFYFDPPVCPGTLSSGGESTYFFGIASIQSPQPVAAKLKNTEGKVTHIEARAPIID